MDKHEALHKIQELEQNLQSLLQQKNNIILQKQEVESALKEVEKTNTTYKIIYNVMIKKEKEETIKELKEQLELITFRLNTLEKQEENYKKELEELQKKVIEKKKQ